MSEDKIRFRNLIENILPNEKEKLTNDYVYFLSALNPDEAALLKQVWHKIPLRRRRAIIEDAGQLLDEEEVVSFIELGKIALEDPDAQVRFYAVNVLWEEDEEDIAHRLLDVAESDPDAEVRANAAAALSHFMELGALEEINESLHKKVEEALFGILEDRTADERVRRRALESLGYSQNRTRLDEFIHQALQSDDEEWYVSALRAIGNTMDEEWAETVLPFLEHVNPKVRAEAARAAGLLGVEDAVEGLLYLLKDHDQDVRMMAAWALSEIGGEPNIERALHAALKRAANAEEERVIRDAIDNLHFTNAQDEFLLMNFTHDELEEMIHTMGKDEFRKMLELDDDEIPVGLEDLLGDEDEE